MGIDRGAGGVVSNPSKQRGTAFEAALVNYLHRRGHPHIERRTLSGAHDRGDIAGVASTVIEAKACRTITLSEWVNEAQDEARNANASIGIVVAKRRGTSDVGQAYAVLPFAQLVTLLEEAGRLP
jgi:hypothetical protein